MGEVPAEGRWEVRSLRVSEKWDSIPNEPNSAQLIYPPSGTSSSAIDELDTQEDKRNT